MLGATHGRSRVDGQDAAGGQPVEQHADGGQVLLDGRLLEATAELLDVGRDVQRLDQRELAEAVPLAPGEEARHGRAW